MDAQTALEAEAVGWVFAGEPDLVGPAAIWYPKTFTRTTPLRDWAKAATHPNPRVRSTVARHRDCPPEVLVWLSEHTEPAPAGGQYEWDILVGVAANPNTPPELLAELGATRHGRVLMALTRNPAVDRDTLAVVLQRDGTLQRAVERHPNWVAG